MSLLLLALALSMDVFAAALTRGIAVPRGATLRTALIVGLALGAAQGLMPLVGWSLSTAVTVLVRDVDHWIAFVLLVLVGIHMLEQGISAKGRAGAGGGTNSGTSLLLIALATSVDAAAAGATLAGLEQTVPVACVVLGVTGFAFAAVGVYLGKAAGDAIGPRAQILGGVVLIALAVKTVVEHEFFGG